VSGSGTIAVSVEATLKKAFATAVDWPGWSRSGKTEELALAALQDYGPRYGVVAAEAVLPFEPGDYEVVERAAGAAGTDFGVPSSITDLDRRPMTAVEAERRTRLVHAAWIVFGRVVAGAPAELRKGPRGGGRDRDKIVAHVIEAEWAYAREMGIKVKQPDPTDPAAIDLVRNAMVEVLREPSDGSALEGRRWTARYAASRISWHVLDHTWEIEDRSDPA
jgi:hypothetical protein